MKFRTAFLSFDNAVSLLINTTSVHATAGISITNETTLSPETSRLSLWCLVKMSWLMSYLLPTTSLKEARSSNGFLGDSMSFTSKAVKTTSVHEAEERPRPSVIKAYCCHQKIKNIGDLLNPEIPPVSDRRLLKQAEHLLRPMRHSIIKFLKTILYHVWPKKSTGWRE